MPEFLQLFKDTYFLGGITLFFASLVGLVWVLKTLQKESSLESIESVESAVPSISQTVEVPKDQTQTMEVPARLEVPSPNVTQMLEQGANANLETLREQLDHIEVLLLEVNKKINQIQSGMKAESS